MDEGCARFLVSAPGAALLRAALEVRRLPMHRRARALAALGTPEQVRAALSQDDLRQRAAERCPHAQALLFTGEALEQATAWPVAVERAGRWGVPSDVPLTDLTAGIGLDALATALAGRAVHAFEHDAARALLLEYNAEVLGVAERIAVHAEDACAAAPRGPQAYLDPGRRPEGRRTRDPDAFDPPQVVWPDLLRRFERAMVKLPPVVAGDLHLEGAQEIVSLGGRARERRLFVGAWADLPARRALALPSGRSIAGVGAPRPSARAVHVGDWLLDPDVSVTLAGLLGDLAARDGLRTAHDELPYLLAEHPKETAPGHWMQVEALLPPKPKVLNAWLAAHGVGRVTIRTRGLERQASAWRKQLRPRGTEAATLVFTRDLRDRWVVYACREHPA